MRFGISILAILSAASAVVAQSASIPPPPAESTGCVLHEDHYHCAGRADGQPATPTTAAPSMPSPTDKGACHWHETHWDCEADEAAGDEGPCIIHVGHTHGHCTEADMACGQVLLEHYNMPLHIGAVFIILVTSALGVMIPLVAGQFRSKDGVTLDAAAFGRDAGFWGNVFFLARHFGTGIIISTAFIHLLYHGFVMFNNKCVGHLGYESTAPAISMAGAFVTFLLDFIGSRAGRSKLSRHNSGSDSLHDNTYDDAGKPENERPVQVRAESLSTLQAQQIEEAWQAQLLEIGIIFHSIMIGVTLGAGAGVGWTTLLIVIVFHQFFEGAALGARLALLTFMSRWRVWLLGSAFAAITPIGVAIGIGVRKSFSQNGKASLLSVGILNSISAGILLYTAFKLLESDFGSGPLKRAKLSTVLAALTAIIVGLIAMSVLGKWA